MVSRKDCTEANPNRSKFAVSIANIISIVLYSQFECRVMNMCSHSSGEDEGAVGAKEGDVEGTSLVNTSGAIAVGALDGDMTGANDGLFEGIVLGGNVGQSVTILEYNIETFKVFVYIHPPEGGRGES